jgi:hypothetical protein
MTAVNDLLGRGHGSSFHTKAWEGARQPQGEANAVIHIFIDFSVPTPSGG